MIYVELWHAMAGTLSAYLLVEWITLFRLGGDGNITVNDITANTVNLAAVFTKK